MENKMPQTKENSLPFYWKNICRFFGKSTCRLQSAPLMKKERNYAIIKDEKDPILFQLRSDDYGIFDQSYTLSCS